MAYGIEIYNSTGIKIVSTAETSYYVSKEGTITPDASGTAVTNFSNVSALSYAYYLDDSYLYDHNQISSVTTWNGSTTYSVGDYVIISGTVGSNSAIYECLVSNSNNHPTVVASASSSSYIKEGDSVYWRLKRVRNNYSRANDALFSEIENQNALIFFKLPSVGDIISKFPPFGILTNGESTATNAIDYEAPVCSNLSSLDYAVVKPLTDFTPSVSGYGLQIYDASGNTIHVTDEKLAHIDNFANRIGVDATITSSGSTINWVGLPMFFFGNRLADYNNQNNGDRFTNYIKRKSNVEWQHKVDRVTTSVYTTGNTSAINASFFVGRFD